MDNTSFIDICLYDPIPENIIKRRNKTQLKEESEALLLRTELLSSDTIPDLTCGQVADKFKNEDKEFDAILESYIGSPAELPLKPYDLKGDTGKIVRVLVDGTILEDGRYFFQNQPEAEGYAPMNLYIMDLEQQPGEHSVTIMPIDKHMESGIGWNVLPSEIKQEMIEQPEKKKARTNANVPATMSLYGAATRNGKYPVKTVTDFRKLEINLSNSDMRDELKRKLQSVGGRINSLSSYVDNAMKNLIPVSAVKREHDDWDAVLYGFNKSQMKILVQEVIMKSFPKLVEQTVCKAIQVWVNKRIKAQKSAK